MGQGRKALFSGGKCWGYLAWGADRVDRGVLSVLVCSCDWHLSPKPHWQLGCCTDHQDEIIQAPQVCP